MFQLVRVVISLLLWSKPAASLASLFPSTNAGGKKLVDSNGSQPFFIKKGERFIVTSRSAMDLHEFLPVATYTVDIDPCDGSFYLKQVDDFEIGEKVYGDTVEQAGRIFNSYLARKGSTGVLLAGEKGSGKTFLAKYLSIHAAKQGIPTIVVNQALHGDRFNSFIQSIVQPVVVMFDEFEKVYRSLPHEQTNHHNRHGNMEGSPNTNQDSVLTLLDGVYPANILFLLTVNDQDKISDTLRNRPGRIYYYLDFKGVSPGFIRECKHSLDFSRECFVSMSNSQLFY